MSVMFQSKKQPGFTLIELLVATTIIIVLTSIGLVSYRRANINARNAKRQADLETVRQALILFKSEYGYYPNAGTQGTVSELLSYSDANSDFSDYIDNSNQSLQDPKQGLTYSYATSGTCGIGACSFTLSADKEPTTDGLTIELSNP